MLPPNPFTFFIYLADYTYLFSFGDGRWFSFRSVYLNLKLISCVVMCMTFRSLSRVIITVTVFQRYPEKCSSILLLAFFSLSIFLFLKAHDCQIYIAYKTGKILLLCSEDVEAYYVILIADCVNWCPPEYYSSLQFSSGFVPGLTVFSILGKWGSPADKAPGCFCVFILFVVVSVFLIQILRLFL